MTSFEDEELAMIAIVLDEKEEEQKKEDTCTGTNGWTSFFQEYLILFLLETLTLHNSKTIADQQKQIADLESASKNSYITKLNGQNFIYITSKYYK